MASAELSKALPMVRGRALSGFSCRTLISYCGSQVPAQPDLFVKVLGERGFEIDSLFSKLDGATVHDSLEEFLGRIIQQRAELCGKQPRHVQLFYRSRSRPPTHRDIVTSMIVNPHIEEVEFPSLGMFLSGQSPRHYFVAVVQSIKPSTALAISFAHVGE